MTTSADEAAAEQCENRPAASGDIVVRTVIAGNDGPPTAAEFGGQWQWNSGTQTCQTPVQWQLSTALTGPGMCTQVAYAADNPGYDAGATPAPALKKVIASAGPGC